MEEKLVTSSKPRRALLLRWIILFGEVYGAAEAETKTKKVRIHFPFHGQSQCAAAALGIDLPSRRVSGSLSHKLNDINTLPLA